MMSDLHQLIQEVAAQQGYTDYQVKAKQANNMSQCVYNVFIKPAGAKRGKHIASIPLNMTGLFA